MANEIRVGRQVYYTGDMANHSGFGVIKSVTPCKWYGQKILVVLEDGREWNLQPSSFRKSIGQRFHFKDAWLAERNRKIEEMKKRYAHLNK